MLLVHWESGKPTGCHRWALAGQDSHINPLRRFDILARNRILPDHRDCLSPEVRMIALSHLRGDAEALTLEWADGAVHRVTWRELRDRCPCATCAQAPPPAKANTPGRWDLLPVLTLAETQPLRASGMRPLGNYAYAIGFSDGHNTGIYSLDFLRSLGMESASRP